MACVHTLVLARLASLELWDSLFPLSVLSLTAFFQSLREQYPPST